MATNEPVNNLYGFPQPLSNNVFPPIVSLRTPKTTDYAPIGALWIYKTGNAAYILTSIVSNSATWLLLEASGSAGVFTTLTSSGATTLATTGASVNTFGNTTGATSLGLLVGTGGFTVTGVAGSAITIGTGVTTGNITLGGAQTTGTITIGNNVATTSTVTIDAGSGGISNVTTGPFDVTSTDNVTAAIALIANGGTSENVLVRSTLGTQSNAVRLEATAGGITLLYNTAAGFGVSVSNGTQLFKILNGAGAPSNGLAAEAGDLYLRSDPAGATSRIYVATGAGAWTNVTCAA